MKSGLNSYKLALAGIILLFSQQSFSNTKIDLLNTDFMVDFRSMHTWRGSATSFSPTIEPSFEITRNNSTTGIWFAQSVDGNYTELDLYFTYAFKSFSFTIYDYYCPPSIQVNNEIANYDKYTTKHTIDFELAYNGTPLFPFKILVATMVYGDDINSETNQKNYSTYCQFEYTTEIDNNSINIFLGLNCFKSYYGDQFGVVNAGLTASKNIKAFKTKEIPIQASLITNPLSNSLFLTFGFTL